MPRAKYVPKHRSAPVKPVRTAASTGVRNAAVLSGVAVVATGITVSSGVLGGAGNAVDGATVRLSAAGTAQLSTADLAERTRQASRSSEDRRAVADSAKARALDNDAGRAVTNSADLSDADPRTIARALMPQYGLSSAEFDCLDRIWTQESHWNVYADNPRSSAYGIPQALPGSKMASAGPDWATSAETQIRWGLGYIKGRYGTACSAWSFKRGHGWY